MTDPRDPTKPPERAAGQPVAILRNAVPARDLVPAEAVAEPERDRPATLAEVKDSRTRRRAINQPVLPSSTLRPSGLAFLRPNVQLVVPEPLIAKFPPRIRTDIVTLESFLGDLRLAQTT